MIHNRQAARWFVALAITGAVLATSDIAVKLNIGVAAAIPGFIFLALLASWKAGFRAAALVSVISAVCLDYFFTEPKFSLTINSYQDLLALVSFLAISILISHLVERIRTATTRLHLKEKEQRELLQLSQSILISDWKSIPEDHLCKTVQEQLGLEGAAFWDEKTFQYWFSGNAGDARERLTASLHVAKDYDSAAIGEHIRVLRFGTRSIGAVLFRGAHASPLFIDAVAALIASSLERIRAMRAEVLAESVAISEQLRTAVLDGLAHSVKTPLTTIAVSASGLRQLGGLSPLQEQFACTIEEQAMSISELTSKLLRTSRLDRQDLIVKKRPVALRRIFESALAELPAQLRGDRIRTRLPSHEIKVLGDPDILRMAIVQLLENGLKYSPSGSPVTIHVTCVEGEVELGIHNEGTFIPLAERHLIFQRYYRSPSIEHKAPGTGLGLSIAKRAVDVHQGALKVESSRESGTTFLLSLPKGETC